MSNPAGLSELNLKLSYRSDEDDLVNDFYIPCLSRSVSYDRAVGFFTAQGLSLAARGVARLIRNDGRMRLIFGALVADSDRDQIMQGYEDRLRDALLHRFRAELEKIDDDVLRKRVQSLAWLIAIGKLEVKVAVRLDALGRVSQAIYHEKMGVFEDGAGNKVAFIGSSNETPAGLADNFESNDVYRSWDESEKNRVAEKVRNFERLWNNSTKNLWVLDFTDAARNQLLRFRPKDAPNTDPEEKSVSATGRNLYKFQEEAIAAWKEHGFRGILAMATGTGKTFTALRAVTGIKRPIVVVVVPLKDLVDQWCRQIESEYLENCRIVRAYSYEPEWPDRLQRLLGVIEGNDFDDRPNFVVTTYDTSISERFQRLIAASPPERTVVILDEVHHAGAIEYRRVFAINAKYRLGLSATPERQWDDEGNQAIFEYLGSTVFEYNIGKAIDAGILCKYDYYVHPVSLTSLEREQFRDLSNQIVVATHKARQQHPELSVMPVVTLIQALDRYDSMLANKIRSLYLKRVGILKKASNKTEALKQIIANYDLKRCLVYCNDLSHVEEASRVIFDAGYEATEYSSRVSSDSRKRILESFAKPSLSDKFLVAVRCLDEGIDLPICDSAVVVASSRSTREFVQRRGRLLRKHPTKTKAVIHDILVLPFLTNDEAYPLKESEYEIVNAELARVREFASSATSSNVCELEPILGRLSFAGYHKD